MGSLPEKWDYVMDNAAGERRVGRGFFTPEDSVPVEPLGERIILQFAFILYP
jgi:hypothetical protein